MVTMVSVSASVISAFALLTALLDPLPIEYAPPPPPDRGSPQTSDRGGASRGGCPPTELALTALVPAVSAYGGDTLAAHPTVWVYQPYSLGPGDRVDFFLRSIDDQTEIYRTSQTPSAAPGLMHFTVPDTAPALEPDKAYDWYVLIFCNAERRRVTPAYTQGWVRRVELEITSTTTDSVEQSRLYAAQGLWYDAFNHLVIPGASPPDEPAETARQNALARLLQAVGLTAFRGKPVTGCCDLDNLSSG